MHDLGLCSNIKVLWMSTLKLWICRQVDSKELSEQTMLSVPGYENKVEFGTMLTFAYPIEGHGEYLLMSRKLYILFLGLFCFIFFYDIHSCHFSFYIRWRGGSVHHPS